MQRFRIRVEEIGKVRELDAKTYKCGLMLREQFFPRAAQDTITISIEAAGQALKRSSIVAGGINPQAIGALYIGSESHPYAVKPSGTVLIDARGIGPGVHVAD